MLTHMKNKKGGTEFTLNFSKKKGGTEFISVTEK